MRPTTIALLLAALATAITSTTATDRPNQANAWGRSLPHDLAQAGCGSHLVGPRSDCETPVARNVLFIVSDDLRASALACYGDPMGYAPNIDRLAREGVVFERAYCQGTHCAPSRISFMFSRYRGRDGVNLGEHLRGAGFYTARVGKIYHMLVPRNIIAGEDGEDLASTWVERFNSQGDEAHTPGAYACFNQNVFTTDLENRESSGMPHRAFVSVVCEGDGSDQADYKTATKTIDLLRERRDGPFFIAAGFVRPHYPMVAPPEHFDRFDWRDVTLPPQIEGDLDDIPQMGRAGSNSRRNGLAEYPDNQKRMWAAYYAAISFMDEQVGRILDELDRLGLRESTAIVFTSDHGYHLGDHTFWQKLNLHEEVTRVPLIVAAPGMTPARSDSIVELVDVYPTVCELVGAPVPNGLDGASLVPVLEDPTVDVKDGALSMARGYLWRTEAWAYMRYEDGSEELYDMRADPQQIHNLASSPEHQAVRKGLAAALDRRLQRSRSP